MTSIDLIGKEKGIGIPAYIRVVLFPVGNINATTFKKYASLIQKCEEVPLSQLTRFADDNKKSPFVSMDWLQNRLRFYFVDGTNVSTQFTEIHQYRKIHAVIGVMSCLSEDNVADGYEKYQTIKKQFQTTTQIGRCFAVEPLEDQPDVEKKELVMIPNQDIEHLEFYIVSQFNDLALELLRNFENFAGHPKHLLSLASVSDELRKQVPLSEVNQKKRVEIRMIKIFADYALLAGDIIDATIKYQQAIDIAKTMPEDVVSYASVLEGLAAALYWKYMTFNASQPIMDEIIQKYEEAIQMYGKSTFRELHIECLLRFAHFNAFCTGPSRKTQALDCITRAVESSSILTTQERILVCGYAAKLCYAMGLKRKFAFFLRETTIMHTQLHNQSVSMKLGSLYLDSYHIPINMQDSEWKYISSKSSKERGWQKIQLKLLRDMITFAATMSPADYLTEAQLTLYLLCAYYDILKWSEQLELFERFCELSRRISQSSENLSLLPLPLLSNIDPQKMPSHLEPIAHKAADSEKSSIFIFSPFDRDDSTVVKINWVQNELAKILVSLRNPFLFEIILKRISLKVKLDNGDCEVYETSATIPPGKSYLCEIIVKPLGSGRLTILAVEVEFEKCNLKHPLSIPVHQIKSGEKNVEITVLETIPLLNVHIPSSVISLFDGESLSTTLTFQNISSNAIHTIVTSVENRTRSSLWVDNASLQKNLPLNPNGQTISANLLINGRWNGDNSSTVYLKVKYFGVSYEWYREISIPIQLNIMRGLVVLRCFAINEQYGREIIAEIQNQSVYPFVLLSNNEEQRRVKFEGEKGIMERHNNVDWKQFVEGIPMAPGSKKMIIVGSHILHEKMGEKENASEPFHIAYSANIDEYKEEIASRLRWKSHMNTYGVVGYEFPVEQVQPKQTYHQSIQKENEVVPVSKEQIDLKLKVILGNNELELDNFDVNAIRTTPPTFKVAVNSSQMLSWILYREPKHTKKFRVVVQVYQDAPNGSRIVVSPDQFAYSGQLIVSAENFDTEKEQILEDSTTKQYTHQVQLFFLEVAQYNLSIECIDDATEELLAKPLQVIIRATE
jgi:tetratricopeptide (TPR) repeat protein